MYSGIIVDAAAEWGKKENDDDKDLSIEAVQIDTLFVCTVTIDLHEKAQFFFKFKQITIQYLINK